MTLTIIPSTQVVMPTDASLHGQNTINESNTVRLCLCPSQPMCSGDWSQEKSGKHTLPCPSCTHPGVRFICKRCHVWILLNPVLSYTIIVSRPGTPSSRTRGQAWRPQCMLRTFHGTGNMSPLINHSNLSAGSRYSPRI